VLNPVNRKPLTPPGDNTEDIVDADLLDALGLEPAKASGL